MLFQAMSVHPQLWSLYRESQPILSKHFPLALEPGASSVVRAADVGEATQAEIEQEFFDQVGNVEGGSALLSRGLPLILRNRLSGRLQRLGAARKTPPIRIVEKTPDNCFRLNLLERVFPDALYLYVLREAQGSIASIYHGWKDESRFRRYQLPAGFTIKGYDGDQWCFGVPPGWEDMDGAALMEVCAFQWRAYNEFCLQDLPDDPDRVMQVRYEELSSRPGPVLDAIASWAQVDPAPFRRFAKKLPVVNTWTKPREDKWRRVEDELTPVLEQVRPMSERLGYGDAGFSPGA